MCMKNKFLLFVILMKRIQPCSLVHTVYSHKGNFVINTHSLYPNTEKNGLATLFMKMLMLPLEGYHTYRCENPWKCSRYMANSFTREGHIGLHRHITQPHPRSQFRNTRAPQRTRCVLHSSDRNAFFLFFFLPPPTSDFSFRSQMVPHRVL